MPCQVVFQPSGRRGEVSPGTNLLDAARQLGVAIKSPCGGTGMCGKCKVQVVTGFFPKLGLESSPASLTPLTGEEKKYLTEDEIQNNYRLACQAMVEGDVLLAVPEESREVDQVILTAGVNRSLQLNPAVRQYRVKCPAGSLADQRSDWERLQQALKEEYGLSGDLTLAYPALLQLPAGIRQQGGEVTVTTWQDRVVLALEPGAGRRPLGVAVDLGTTTVAAYLCDLATGEVLSTASAMNPQVRYGEDVLSRITYARESATGLADLHETIVRGLNELLDQLVTTARVAREQVMDLVIVGNTAMQHLLLNLSPDYLGQAPYLPAVREDLNLKARDLGINVHAAAKIHLLPVIGGFVGADHVAVLIAEEPYRSDAVQLIVDIGTNGEIALASQGKVAATSCATGPALEGAHIKFGMRAAPGAIEKVSINPDTLEVDYKVIGREEWASAGRPAGARGICGSGIIDAVAELFKAGVISRSGRFNRVLPTNRVRRNEEGKMEFVIAWAGETAIGRDITITQSDIRAVQLAKAALYAGARYLMAHMGVERVDEVILAGAFGSYINPLNALAIGMFPDCPPEKIRAVGNAAGDGARLALLSLEKRQEARNIARQVHLVETSLEADFQEQFVQAMALPHGRDAFPHLDHILKLVPRTA
ncbi:MAG: hypothetical protein PWP41_738 [Moorella sp. (in: firmicutes)]|uniref:Ferredoxin--NAD(P)(+) reductase (Naphthalene dioxygenase ferredoxin-specific) n=1 Tax=Neomoorella thermoacetica TaxID=1525 RepID=A0A1J5NNV2_NEOTH|nr:hypothetical protein [Moorella sp. (in: firmicutes)]OIQ60865.1 ferredoxin--NAD(P)(+) reductase (naphthalene dioxygenase ferredoxin-specific) [Moorella thermoacetica]